MFKKISFFVIILLIFLAIYNLGKQIYGAMQSGQRLDQAANELNALQEKNRLLHNQLSQVDQYSFIEEAARDKLNMAKSNETVVIIPQSTIDKALELQKKVVAIKIPNWQAWLKLVFH